jgi:hypothetical protein
MSNTFSSLMMSVIVVAMITTLVLKRQGQDMPNTIAKLGAYMSAAIKTLLGG